MELPNTDATEIRGRLREAATIGKCGPLSASIPQKDHPKNTDMLGIRQTSENNPTPEQKQFFLCSGPQFLYLPEGIRRLSLQMAQKWTQGSV